MEAPLELAASIFDLSRRVTDLEKATQPLQPMCDLVLMVRCYRDAHAVLGGLRPEHASAWVTQAYLWDVRALLALGRAVDDPFPFRPLLAVLDHCVRMGIPSAEPARARFLPVAQDLLTAEGLEIVRPRDTMHRLALPEALRAAAAGSNGRQKA